MARRERTHRKMEQRGQGHRYFCMEAPEMKE
jgi:hypothetical protein